ncbi:MAG: VanZ family protein [Leucobacter sp.]
MGATTSADAIGEAPMPRRKSLLRVGIGVAGLAVVMVLVCLITLSPSPVERGNEEFVTQLLEFLHSKGVPAWFGPRKLEFSANIVMFVPLGLFVGLLLPLHRAWIGGVAGTSFSMLVEIVQFVLLPERYASVLDVLANALGGWIGIGLAVLLRLGIAARDRRIVAGALASRGAVPEDPAPAAGGLVEAVPDPFAQGATAAPR